jgi:hypothetical protein
MISGTGAAICTAVVVARCNGRWYCQHILAVSIQHFTELGRSADLLRRFIWSYVFCLMRSRDGAYKGTSHFVQISEKVRRKPWQWLDKRLGKKAWAVHGKCKHTETEEGEKGEERSQKHAPGRPNSQFRILLWNFTATAWKCEKTSTRNLATKQPTLPFTPGKFWPKTTWLLSPTHPTFLCFPDWR